MDTNVEEGQRRAWYTELKAEFPELEDEFINLACKAFQKEPHIYVDLFKNERKRQRLEDREREKAGTPKPPPTSGVSIAEFERRQKSFEAHQEAIIAGSSSWVIQGISGDTELIPENTETRDVVNEEHTSIPQSAPDDLHFRQQIQRELVE
jgi:hypothetical protein